MAESIICGGPALVFGGPYSNLQATGALFAAAKAHGIPSERIICTGDVTAYCADAEATATLIRQAGIPVVMGNTDESLAGDGESCGCGFDAGSACDLLSARWMAHARETVSNENRRWMATFLRRIDLVFPQAELSFAVVHGSPRVINRFVFASTPDDELRDEIHDIGADGIISGHCGLPYARTVSDIPWINAGVIGMPANDGTCDGWYAVIEPAGSGICVRHHRLAFDHLQAAARMRAAGLPEAYAASLETGLWPNMDILPSAERRMRGQALSLPPFRWSGRPESQSQFQNATA